MRSNNINNTNNKPPPPNKRKVITPRQAVKLNEIISVYGPESIHGSSTAQVGQPLFQMGSIPSTGTNKESLEGMGILMEYTGKQNTEELGGGRIGYKRGKNSQSHSRGRSGINESTQIQKHRVLDNKRKSLPLPPIRQTLRYPNLPQGYMSEEEEREKLKNHSYMQKMSEKMESRVLKVEQMKNKTKIRAGEENKNQQTKDMEAMQLSTGLYQGVKGFLWAKHAKRASISKGDADLATNFDHNLSISISHNHSISEQNELSFS